MLVACRRMGDKGTPYKAHGERLRLRREQLQKDKRLGRLNEWVKQIPVTVSGYLSWERGEYWPRAEKKKKLAALMGLSEIELDHGPQHGADGPEVNRLVKAFGWLMEEEREALLRDLEARAATNKAIAKQMGPRFTIASDATYLAVLKRGGDFPPGSKKAKTTKPRRGSRFSEEDPE